MTFEQIPKPFIRSKAEAGEEKNEQPVEDIASRFFDDFLKRNVELIKAGNLGIVSNDLKAAIHRLVSITEKDKGKEYSDELAKHILAGLDIYRPIVPDREKDPAVKVMAKEYLLNYITPGEQAEFEHEHKETNF
jgi:hypothetical protein